MKRNSLMKGFPYNTPTKESTFVNVNSYNNNNADHEDYYYMNNGFPWPPRSYTCSFCRKEFKSAQALGGHMNVHRRDRARLRQSPPPTHDNHQGQGHNMLNLNLDPIITTNYTNNSTSSLLLPSSLSSSSYEPLKPVTCTLPLFVSPNSTTSPSFSSPCASHSSELKRLVVVDGILLNPLSTTESTKSKIDESLSGNVGEYDHAFAREGHGCKMLKKGEILRMDLEIGLPRDYDLDLELRLGTTYS